MRAFAVVLALVLGVGCIVAAAWLGSQPPKDELPASQGTTSDQPAPEGVVGPEISATGPYPKAVAPETEYNFGVGVLHSKGKHTFIVRNEGEAPLVLMAHEKDRTCQCTGANLSSDDPVLPGQETEILLSWEIRQDVPQFRHSAKIRTNDPENKVITLSVTGKIEKHYDFDPPLAMWDLGDLSEETHAKSSKIIYSKALDDFEIKDVKPSSPRVKLTWEPVGKDELERLHARTGYRLNLEVNASEVAGAVSESVELNLEGNGETSTTLLPIRFRKSSAIELMARNFDPNSNRLMLGEFPANEGKTVEISVYTHVEGDVELISATSAHDVVKVAWEKDEKFESKSGKVKRYRLKVEVPTAAPVNRRAGDSEKVQLKFDHPSIGEMTLLVDYLSV